MARSNGKEPDVLALTVKYARGWMHRMDMRRWESSFVLRTQAELLRDLGADLSSQKLFIVDQVIFCALRLTELQKRVLRGEEIDWNNYGYVSNVMLGHLKTLGLERQYARYVETATDRIQGAANV